MSDTGERRAVKQWWADNPMTYGATHGQTTYSSTDGTAATVELGTRQFFERVDETFYNWNRPLHANGVPFARMFPYESYRNSRVLEVGCGMGTMAMNWAKQGALITPCDLNPVAVTQTSNRLKAFELTRTVVQADGGSLPFSSESFDYVYSWGVLHHSPRLEDSIAELFRVLKPGGGYGVMLYNRKSLRYRYLVELIEGLLHGESKFLAPTELASRYADASAEEGNPHTWPVTRDEMRQLFQGFSGAVTVDIFGDKELRNTLKLMLPFVWRIVPDVVLRTWATSFGWSVWIHGVKN